MEELVRRVQEAGRQLSATERRIAQLQEDKLELEQRVRTLETQLELHKRESRVLALPLALPDSVAAMSPREREALRARIDAYLKEIDACLSFLGE
ncbi:MAG: hypothetical protein NW241_22695 [Bacteroidia bacterium]|nr:hypothetical protein [Bacteroidia bacterium]